MKLTEQTYYGREAAQKYMSVSQFKAFQKCEAAALAEIRGEYVRPETTALLVGSYVDAKLDGPEAFEAFKTEHPEIFKRDGTLKADFAQADVIYERIVSDRLMSLLLSGKKQVIVTGKIAGVPFRGKMDSLLDADICKTIMTEFPGTAEVLGGPFTTGAIVDGKVMRGFDPVWSDSEGRKLNWVDAWGYVLQGAVYQKLEKGHKPFIIAAASKEDDPDLTALYIPQAELDAALRIVEVNAPVYQEIKMGKREPIRCEHCEYCRRTKKITGIRNYKEV